MRTVAGILVLIFTAGLVWVLDNPLGNMPGLGRKVDPGGTLPAIGRLLDPVNGCMANAEPVHDDQAMDLQVPGLQQGATVSFDDRMVPHISAGNDHDIYCLQGYVHAYFRLWQMDMETRAAAGRVSEVVPKAVKFDRTQRRKGMVYAAENSLKAMESDPRTKLMLDAYTEGINLFISKLKYATYPLEYKLLGFAPEKWTNLKSALLLKYMADDLTGHADDIPLTYLRSVLPADQFRILYPETISGSSPVIPSGTRFDSVSLTRPVPPADSVQPKFTNKDFNEARPDGKGSNNWALSGKRTESGAAILCNDPHLGLNLPSLWFEVQLQAPGMNVYGASLPGAPGIVIGFNDSVTWGVTNNYRDVKDFYQLKIVDGNAGKYWFDGKQLAFTHRIERIAVKGQPDIVDTVNYSIHGPVMYDEHNPAPGGLKRPLAMCWMAHRATNELLALYLMNRAKDYPGFVAGIQHFECPAQNFAYADRAGNIAMWGQGQFVNKWKGQGKYIMDGADRASTWGQLIPMGENPHVLNPEQGFVTSANQSVTDSTYPYWYNGDFVELRAWRLNDRLNDMHKATVSDMFALQNDTYSILAAHALPYMLKHVPTQLSDKEQGYIAKLRKWNYQLSSTSISGSVFQLWWFYLYNDIWAGLSKVPDQLYPLPERTMQLIETTDSELAVVPQLKNFDYLVKRSFRQAMDSLNLAAHNGPEWYKVKNTSVTHLAKLPAFSYDTLKIGGWGNTVNAAKGDHGPSWRMVVQMGKEIEAFGVYPGGQSGNPGSAHYADFLQSWAAGKYYKLLFLPSGVTKSSDIKYTWTAHR